MKHDWAEVIALTALAHIGGDERALIGFLAQSGAGPDDLRARIGDPEFLAGVIDYLLANEPLLLAFCEAEGLSPDVPARARRALPGGEAMDGTLPF